ncbi:MAG: alpha/beta hydrolase [Patescibacteria group bacterium]
MILKNAKLVEFITSDRLKLPGMLFEPKKKSRKALIYLHGNGSSSVFYSLNRLREQAEFLAGQGIAFFAFNNRGSGQISKVKKIFKSGEKKVPAGTAYELIRDCVKDIDGAVAFLKSLGYREFYLIGFSTGANKICVYNFYRPKNPIAKYILVGGADDSGMFYRQLGRRKFEELLKIARKKISVGKGKELIPHHRLNAIYSYQAFYDTANPDGDYNIFPFNEALKKLKLSKKKLFRHFSSITKPTLAIYGEKDEYCSGPVRKVVEILKKQVSAPDKFRFAIFKKADHGLSGKERALARLVADWLKG